MKFMPFVTANDISIYYEMYGEGPPLLLINGFAYNHLSWKEFIPSLANHFQVTIFDNRGSGQSDAPIDSYSIKMFAEDTVALMEKLGMESAHFLGESMGTPIILQMCMDHPDRIKKAVLCSPFVHLPEITQNNLRVQLQLLSQGADLHTLLTLNASWMLSNQFFNIPHNLEQYMQEINSNPFPQTREGLQGQADALFDCDLRSEMGAIPHELLLLVGERDICTPPYCAQWIADKALNCKTHIFKEMGHQFNYEIPERVLKHVLAFLKN